MNALQRIAIIVVYEWKRALAKKWFFALVVMAFAVQILVFVVFNYLITFPLNVPPSLLEGINQTKPVMWIVEVLSPQGFFMSIIAIMIAGGSMAEEYEAGTTDVMLSKPITRLEFITGKYLGDFSLLSFVAALTTLLGVILASAFGSQDSLQFIPYIYLAIIFSNTVFLSLAFMLSEVLRRSTLAYFSATLIAFMHVFMHLISFVYSFTGEQLYNEISKWLPGGGTSTFPALVMGELVDIPSNPFISSFVTTYVSHTGGGSDILLTGALIVVYSAIFITVATIRIVRSDVTKKTA
jgi:ABC-2 type transport system permease protein